MEEKRQFDQATAIKIAAVATALPRWAGALMVSEGVPLPEGWLLVWRWLVLILTCGMAVAEAFGISYMLHAARIQGDKKSKWLTPLIILNLAVFAIIISPYAYANMRGISVSAALPFDAVAWLWAIAVPVSTGAIVAGVGFADRSKSGTQSGTSTGGTNRNASELKAELVTLYTQKPGVSLRKAGEELGIAHTTVRRYLNQLVSEGAMAKNGSGYEIVEELEQC
jgi:hypothetical protein